MQPAVSDSNLPENPLPRPPARLTIVSHSMGAGGAERLVSILAAEWATRGREVTLITLEAEGSDFYDLPTSVHRIGLALSGRSSGLWAALCNNWSRVSALRRHIRASRADVVISFVDNSNLLTLLATALSRQSVVVCEQVHPGHHPIGPVRSCLRKVLYPRARAVVVQTEQIREWMREHVQGSSLYVIPNPVLPCHAADVMDAASPEALQRAMVSMGRLVPQKGFDLLLRAFASCAEGHPEWVLQIMGEGPEEEALRTLASELGIAERVHFLGLVKKPHIVFHRSEFFVLPSRFEGLPNALSEAMACGLAAVAFDCPSGPRDVIRHGVDGLLVPPENVEALGEALDRLMSDGAERKRLGLCAPAVVDRFSVERVVRMWDSVLMAATAV